MYKNMCSKALGLLVIFSLFLVACSPNAPAENTPDAPAENTPDAPAENTPDAPAENTPDALAENTPDPPTENTPDPPTENTPDPPTENTPDAPAENTPDAPAENTPDAPAENTPDPPAENTPDPPAENTPDPPAENTPDPPAENTPDPPAENTPDPPTENTPDPPAETELSYSNHFDYPPRPSYVIDAHEYSEMPDAAIPNRGSVVVKQLGGLIPRSSANVEANLVCNFHVPAGSELLLYHWNILEGNIIIYDYVEGAPGLTGEDLLSYRGTIVDDSDMNIKITDVSIEHNGTIEHNVNAMTTSVSNMITLETTHHDVRTYKCEAFALNHNYAIDEVQLAFEPPRLRILVHTGEEDDLDSLTNAIPIRDSLGAEDRILSEAPDGSYTIIGEITFPQIGAFFTLKHNGHELDATIQEVNDDQGLIVSNDPVEFRTGDEIILEVKEEACAIYDAESAAAAIAEDPDVADDYQIVASAWNAQCTKVYSNDDVHPYTLTY